MSGLPLRLVSHRLGGGGVHGQGAEIGLLTDGAVIGGRDEAETVILHELIQGLHSLGQSDIVLEIDGRDDVTGEFHHPLHLTELVAHVIFHVFHGLLEEGPLVRVIRHRGHRGLHGTVGGADDIPLGLGLLDIDLRLPDDEVSRDRGLAQDDIHLVHLVQQGEPLLLDGFLLSAGFGEGELVLVIHLLGIEGDLHLPNLIGLGRSLGSDIRDPDMGGLGFTELLFDLGLGLFDFPVQLDPLALEIFTASFEVALSFPHLFQAVLNDPDGIHLDEEAGETPHCQLVDVPEDQVELLGLEQPADEEDRGHQAQADPNTLEGQDQGGEDEGEDLTGEHEGRGTQPESQDDQPNSLG